MEDLIKALREVFVVHMPVVFGELFIGIPGNGMTAKGI